MLCIHYNQMINNELMCGIMQSKILDMHKIENIMHLHILLEQPSIKSYNGINKY